MVQMKGGIHLHRAAFAITFIAVVAACGRACTEFETPECVAIVANGTVDWHRCAPPGNVPSFIGAGTERARLRFTTTPTR